MKSRCKEERENEEISKKMEHMKRERKLKLGGKIGAAETQE